MASCFAAPVVLANPTGASVANGQVSIHQQGNLLQITNSPNAIINWQGFSIGASEITRFLQQSASSAVLNRVIGQNPSAILGALQSNGRVFLINPNGIVFGANAQIDVAGLVAATLQLSDADFLGGKLKFTEVAGAGSVVNEGAITTPSGGQVYLVGASVENKGLIKSPQGEVVLAAGNRVELVSPGTPNLRVEVTAPDNEAVNMGSIVADAGRVGIYAGLIDHSGTIRADSAQLTADGRIVLKATQSATLEAGSLTTANGANGGSVTVASNDTTLVAGKIEAKGGEGHGGTVEVLGSKVGLIGSASIDVSGETGGGTVLVGGDFQGKTPEVQNAWRTYVGPETTITADAVTNGDGGKVIVWSDDASRAYGSVSAKGGSESGDGGFVEVSGKNALDFAGTVKASATNGAPGTLLLDPANINVATGGGAAVTDLDAFADNPGTTQTIDPGALDAAGTTVVLQATNDVTVSNSVNLATAGAGFIAQAGNDINVNAAITTNGGIIHLEADSPHQPGGPDDVGVVRVKAAVASNGGKITLIAGAQGNANDLGGFTLNADVDAGAGGINVSLSRAAIAPLEFFIGAGGNTQLSSNEVKRLKTTGALVLGEALTAGPTGQSTSVATGSVTLTVNKITNDTASPIDLSPANGNSFQLIAGNGGIFLDRPLTTFQNTVLSTTGDVTINDPLSTSSNNLTIIAANLIIGPSGSLNTGGGGCLLNGGACPGLGTNVFWDGNTDLDGGDGVNWFDPFNWNTNAIPTNVNEVTIGTGFGPILVNGAGEAKSLIAGSPLQISSVGDSLTLSSASAFNNTFTLSGGSLAGTGEVTVAGPNGSLTWSGGTMATGGAFFLASGHNGTLRNAITLDRLFDSSGTLTLTDANLGGTGSLNNLGTLVVNNSTLSVPIANSSPVKFNSGTNTITSGNGITGGTVDFLGGTTTFLASSTYNVATTNVSGGFANFNNSAISSNFNLSGGGLGINSGATLSVSSLNINGGTLYGSGAVTGNVSNVAGTVMPGTSPGVLTINGNYTQGPGGTLAVELGGLTAGSQYDQLVVSGNATLGGTLDVSVLPGFFVVEGDTFTVIQAGQVNGSFVTIDYPALPLFSTDYQATRVNVVAASASSLPPPPSQVLIASTEQGVTAPSALQSAEDEEKDKQATDRKPVCKGGSTAQGVSGGAAAGGTRCTSRGCS